MEKNIVTQEDIPDILDEELPEMILEMHETPGDINIYKALQAFG